MHIGEMLFFKQPLAEYLRAHLKKVVRENIPQRDLEQSDRAIIQRVIPIAHVEALKVDFKRPKESRKKVRIDVPFEGDGVRATRSFNFTGSSDFFYFRPSPFSPVFPYGIVEGDRIVIGVSGSYRPNEIKQELASIEDALRDSVGCSRAQVEAHNQQLESLLKTEITQRREGLARVAAWNEGKT